MTDWQEHSLYHNSLMRNILDEEEFYDFVMFCDLTDGELLGYIYCGCCDV